MIAMKSMTIRSNVADILESKNLTTAEFAEKADLTYAQALSLRRGVTARIDFGTLAKICQALDKTPGEILVLENAAAHEV